VNNFKTDPHIKVQTSIFRKDNWFHGCMHRCTGLSLIRNYHMWSTISKTWNHCAWST